MEAAAVWISGVAAGLSLLVALAVTLAWRSSTRRISAEIAELRRLIGAHSPEEWNQPAATQDSGDTLTPFLITDLGVEHADALESVSSRIVLSAAVSEPLVKVAAFAHGVRRALTPENRNRIRFEMRREIRRSRKARRVAGRVAASEARSRAAS